MNDYLELFEKFKDENEKDIVDLIDEVKKLRFYYSTQQYDSMLQHIKELTRKYALETLVWNSVNKVQPITYDQSYQNAEVFLRSKGLIMLIKKGYDEIYVVKLHSIGISQKLAKKVNLKVIEPSRPLGGILNFNQEVIKDNIKMGYYDTIRVLKKLDGYKYLFKVRSNSYYKFISRFIDAKLLKRIYVFFDVDNIKDATIKSLEYVMEKEGYNYYKVYSPYKIVKKIRKNTNRKYVVYDFVRKLKKF